MNQHVHSVGFYVRIFLALLILTGTTVWVSTIELGNFNFIVAISIAILKALLVILFFMHVKEASPLTKVFAVAGLFWFFILLGLTLNDYLTRYGPLSARWW